MAFAKYTPIDEGYNGAFFKFKGPMTQLVPPQPTHHRIPPRSLQNPGLRILHDKIPKRKIPFDKIKQKVIAYGKLLLSGTDIFLINFL